MKHSCWQERLTHNIPVYIVLYCWIPVLLCYTLCTVHALYFQKSTTRLTKGLLNVSMEFGLTFQFRLHALCFLQQTSRLTSSACSIIWHPPQPLPAGPCLPSPPYTGAAVAPGAAWKGSAPSSSSWPPAATSSSPRPWDPLSSLSSALSLLMARWGAMRCGVGESKLNNVGLRHGFHWSNSSTQSI